jgi:hypothetical protein
MVATHITITTSGKPASGWRTQCVTLVSDPWPLKWKSREKEQVNLLRPSAIHRSWLSQGLLSGPGRHAGGKYRVVATRNPRAFLTALNKLGCARCPDSPRVLRKRLRNGRIQYDDQEEDSGRMHFESGICSIPGEWVYHSIPRSPFLAGFRSRSRRWVSLFKASCTSAGSIRKLVRSSFSITSGR